MTLRPTGAPTTPRWRTGWPPPSAHGTCRKSGLGPALSTLAETTAIPARLTVAITARPSPAIEAIAYFCTAELLTNAAKHAAAKNVVISAHEQGSGLRLAVTDDGSGGARMLALIAESEWLRAVAAVWVGRAEISPFWASCV